jgi:hypothetical protein
MFSWIPSSEIELDAESFIFAQNKSKDTENSYICLVGLIKNRTHKFTILCQIEVAHVLHTKSIVCYSAFNWYLGNPKPKGQLISN